MATLAGLVAVVYWPAIFAAPTMPRWWLIAIGIGLVGAFDFRKLDSLCAVLFIAGVAWGAVSTLTNWSLRDGALDFYFLLLIGAVAAMASSLDNIDPALHALSWGVAVSGALCLLQFFHASPIPMIGARPTGLFYNSEVMAETAAPLFVWALLKGRRPLAGLLGIPVALCFAKIAVVASIVGILWPMIKSRPIKALLGMVAGTILVFVLVSILRGEGWIGSAEHRFTLWGAAAYSLTWAGNGFGWWYGAHPFGYEEFVHSDVLQFFVAAGVGGIFFLAIPLVILLRGIPDKAMGGLFAALCFEATVSFPTHVPVGAFLFGLVAGHLAGAGARLRVAQRQRGVVGGVAFRREAAYNSGMGTRRHPAWGTFCDRPSYPADPRPHSI